MTTTRIARAITEIATPAASVIAICLVCGVASMPGWGGMLWGLLTGAFCGAIPYAVLEVASRRGKITDRHVTKRSQRGWAYAMCLASVAAGIAVAVIFRAPPVILWALGTMVAGLILAAGLTAVWTKVSMHAMCVTSFAVVAAILQGPWWLVTLLLLPVIAWSRLKLGHHSFVELVAGTLLGVAVTGGSWVLSSVMDGPL